MTSTEFTDVFPTLYTQLKSRAYVICRNDAEAEDLRAETLCKAWESRRDIRHPKAWAQVTCRNAYLRKFQRLPTLALDAIEDFDVPEKSEPCTMIDDEIVILHHKIGTLNAKHRQAIERYLSGKPCQGTWGSRLHKAREIIRIAWNHNTKPKGE